jgi:hypothetical protein
VGVDTLDVCTSGINSVPTTLQATGDLRTTPVGDLADGAWRTATIRLASGRLSVDVSGQSLLSDVALPAYLPGQPYYLGISGGNGISNAALLEARNLSIVFSTPRCL